MSSFFKKISINPIIASIKDLEKIDLALDSPCETIFLLSGNIFNLKEIASKVIKKEKGLFIYVDNIDGFSKDTWGLEYIAKNISLDGIISSKSNIIKLSKSMGVFTIQRINIIDTESLNNCFKSIKEDRPHAIEILPGIMPSVIERIVKPSKIPLISTGLITKKEDILSSLNAGAIAISSSDPKTWNINI